MHGSQIAEIKKNITSQHQLTRCYQMYPDDDAFFLSQVSRGLTRNGPSGKNKQKTPTATTGLSGNEFILGFPNTPTYWCVIQKCHRPVQTKLATWHRRIPWPRSSQIVRWTTSGFRRRRRASPVTWRSQLAKKRCSKAYEAFL